MQADVVNGLNHARDGAVRDRVGGTSFRRGCLRYSLLAIPATVSAAPYWSVAYADQGAGGLNARRRIVRSASHSFLTLCLVDARQDCVVQGPDRLC